MADDDAATYTPGSGAPLDVVRLLLSDVSEPWVFDDAEITALLTLEGGSVKLAAAQAIETQATNEALTAKVLRDHDRTTDGAKLADAMRRHAASLRAQDDRQVAEADDGFYYGTVDMVGTAGRPELTGW